MQPFQFSACAPGRASVTVHRVFCTLTLTLLLQFVPTQLQSVHAQTSQRGPLKFDPLTPEERELATSVAEADGRVKQLRGQGRQLLISVELATPKTNDQNNESGRHAQVLYYRYAGNKGVLALIDLQQRAVQETVAVNGDGVPLAAEEVSEAIALALQNQTLIKLLGPDYQRYRIAPQDFREGQPNPVEALRLLAGSPKDPCYQHRCIALLFRQEDTFLTGFSVSVDLTVKNVLVEQAGSKRAPAGRRGR